MHKHLNSFLLVYTVLSLLVSVSMYLLNEQRTDAYVAVNVLMYYVSYAVIRPAIENASIKVLNAVLVVVFVVIVAVRIYEVLAG